MKCNSEMLQPFLDQELETDQAKELRIHLAQCRKCRQELSRLKLLWLELEQEEEIALPPELPFLRQQAISAGRALAQLPEEGLSFWQSQRLAWEPLVLAFELIPGTQTLGTAVKTVGSKLPQALGVIGKRGLKTIFRGRRS